MERFEADWPTPAAVSLARTDAWCFAGTLGKADGTVMRVHDHAPSVNGGDDDPLRRRDQTPGRQ